MTTVFFTIEIGDPVSTLNLTHFLLILALTMNEFEEIFCRLKFECQTYIYISIKIII